MKAWVTYGYEDMRLEEVPEPEVKKDYVVLKVLAVQPAITETLLFHGAVTHHYDLIKETLEQGPARVFGHEFCGEVVEVGPGVEDLKVGDRVTTKGTSACGECSLCRSGWSDQCQKGPIIGFHIPGSFAEYAAAPKSTLVKIPKTMSDTEGASLQPLTDAIAANAAARMELGDIAVVIGLGSMGMGCMQAARASGAGIVIGVDVKEYTLEKAKELGVDITVNAAKENPVEVVLDHTRGMGADVVFETAGGPPEQGLSGNKTLEQAVDMVKQSGKIIGVALYGEGTLLKYRDFRGSGKQYLFPVVVTKKLLKHTVDLVASKRVQMAPLITHVLEGIDRVPEAFRITANKDDYQLLNPAQVIISKET